MKRSLWIGLVSFFLGILLAGYIFVYMPESNPDENPIEQPKDPTYSSNLHASPSSSSQPKEELDFVQIAEKASPAVVQIEAVRVQKRMVMGLKEWPFDDFWDKFFGVPRDREKEYRSVARGTGFFISPEGYILTNNHIVENAEELSVTSIEGHEYNAEIVGTDPKTDIALLKVKEDGTEYLNLGNSEKLKVGEWVIAIGNPWGLSHTVTAGIVSAKGREGLASTREMPYQDFIQTDASINRGNSGGPLVNMKGEVVGITSMIWSPSGGSIGIGFAISSNLAKNIVKQLKEKGRVIRGYLGVSVQPVNEEFKKLLNLKSLKGAVVVQVEPNTPADKAGLKQYDVILKVEGKPIEDPDELTFLIAETKPATKVDITIIRDGKRKTLTAKVAELEPPEEEEPEETATSEKEIGIRVTTLTPRIASHYNLETQEGVLITNVQEGSLAARKGIQSGDIIIEVNRKRMTSVKDLRQIIEKSDPGDPLMLLIRRESRRETQEFLVTLRVPE
ncbi:Do family serine endopeptidase [bacterium]|nr:Do family serine endopeptidase [bacterium]